MNTEPHETAASKLSPSGVFNKLLRFSRLPPTKPEAIAVKVRYVGALSRKLDNAPDIQKNCHGCLKFREVARALRISKAGIIVTKMPRKIAATSRIG